jgi:hypothetical protein
MAITPPATWNRIDIGPTGAFANGAGVLVGPVQQMAQNHNALYGGRQMPVGGAVFGPGWSGGAGVMKDCCVFSVPNWIDGNTVQYHIWAANADAVDSATISVRYIDGSGPADVQFVIAPSTAAAMYTGQYTYTGSSPRSLIVRCNRAAARVYSVALSRPVLSGSSVSDLPKPSGWRWAQPAQIADDEPVPVEMLNRFARGPYLIHQTQPACMASVSDSPQDPRLGLIESSVLTGPVSSSAWAPHAWLLAGGGYEGIARAAVSGRKLSGGDGLVILQTSTQTITIELTDTAAPSSGVAPKFDLSPDFVVQRGINPIAITLVGAELWSCQIFTRAA